MSRDKWYLKQGFYVGMPYLSAKKLKKSFDDICLLNLISTGLH